VIETMGVESGPPFASIGERREDPEMIVVILCIAVLGLFVITLTSSFLGGRKQRS
jgi:hypothetical protein